MVQPGSWITINAVKKGKVGKRVARRAVGKVMGCSSGNAPFAEGAV